MHDNDHELQESIRNHFLMESTYVNFLYSYISCPLLRSNYFHYREFEDLYGFDEN